MATTKTKYSKRQYSKSGRKSQRGKRKRSSQVSSKVKKYVKKQIHKNIENKMINTQVGKNVGSYLSNNDLQMQPVLPYTSLFSLSQGVLSNNRIGNQVRTRKVTLNYVLRPRGYSATNNTLPQPSIVQLFLGRYKQASGVLPGVLELGTLFQSGNSSFGPTSSLDDLCCDIGDAWDIKKVWIEKVGNSCFNGTGNQPDRQSYQNNDFALNVVRRMNITKYCPKTLRFNDATVSPQGPNLFFFYQAIATDGGVYPAGQYPVYIHYWLTYEYEDA